QLDPENTGFIEVETFASLVHSHELPLDPAKLDMLVALAQGNDEGQVCYQELVDLVSAGRTWGWGGHCAPGKCHYLPGTSTPSSTVPPFLGRGIKYPPWEPPPLSYPLFRAGHPISPWDLHHHLSSVMPFWGGGWGWVQIIVFLCYGARLNKWVLQTYHPEYMKSPLVYHPGHRARAWRFLTYMFMHVGLEQLGFNALLQLMIGVPLEMVHGILRISFLYLAGVLAG
ncbi:RHBL1 protein, partial [Oreotrochilus melanogaster]|nr:RHBL1 protein [Oreotrochilus melanogaster]